MGQVITAGAGQNPARIAAAGAGIPLSVPATTVNKVCLSGLDAIVLADQLVRSGDYDIVIAGGMESMSQAPHLVSNSLGYGDVVVHDSVERDGLWDHFTDQSMGQLTERVNTEQQGPTRSQQDTYAAESHQRAAQAWKDGLRRRGGPGQHSAAPRRTGAGHPRRRYPDRTPQCHWPVSAGVRRGRHDHRRVVLAAVRRRRGGRGDQ